jgi:hypothetical protein
VLTPLLPPSSPPSRFSKVPAGESGLYMDPVTKDTFGNASRLVVLVPSGEVVLKDTYKACVQDEGQFNGGWVGVLGLREWGNCREC